MADPLFKSTLLAQTQDPLENQKAALDLLKKVNDVHALSAAGLDGLQASIDALTAALAASLPISGSNANGYYLKLFDGTLIQWQRGTVLVNTPNNAGGGFVSNAATTFTFPIPFVGSPFMIIPAANSVSYAAQSNPSNATSTSVDLSMISINSGGSGYHGYVAIGKWK